MIALTSRAKLLQSELKNTSCEHFSELVINFIKETGHTRYDESVTQLEHALQAADLASKSVSEPILIASALLHDIGHLLIDEFSGDDRFLLNDLNHELIGARFFEKYLPKEAIATIRLHVPVKRYLCSTEKDYFSSLSNASKRSFELQGGYLTIKQQKSIEQEDYLQSAIKIRKWDDKSKISGKVVPPLEDYRDILCSVRRLV